ncbi:helix-turn-helix transcriptional regulator [Bradyrhizobium sp. GCM10023182]|uniref:Helix-turn-helix transcriptional regulator n=1 Tax=Bradyrhizobium zhengyangense TaxID=2911009 RepID=A0ABS9M0K1_9BRAD|nr:helix-turn-helix transcriptional regulator [Bradyrhizobium zhengyangense]MCG2672793.1 helix-turn-helix transcriptional regulator [Bradyrhizobium zhengyangense]
MAVGGRTRGSIMKFSGEKIERVLDLIYDAAAENDLWPHALTAIADLTRSEGGILFGVSLTAERVYFDFNGRLNEECKRAFQERHIQNPWSRYMAHQPTGRVVLSDEAISLEELRRSAFYDEVLRPQQVAHNGMMALAVRDDFRAAFNMCRSARQGTFDPGEQRLLAWLSPHLCRSVTLGFRIDGYLALQQAAFDVLDRLADGVAVLDRKARVLFANAAARRMAAEGMLRLHQSISTHSPAHSRRLNELIRDAIQGNAGGAMSLPRILDGRLLTILVSSIRSRDLGRLSDGGVKDAAVLLFVIDPANRRSLPLGQIMDVYGLTQAEARVALAASSGNTIFETAQSLGLSPNTIKTHLRRVFAKTATGRQAELAALVAAIGSMRIGETDS